MEEGTKNLKTSTVYQRFQFIYKTMLSYCLKCRKKNRKEKLEGCKEK